ncbi:MAG: twin-arginine translocation signal domain-containing protein, partial [Thermoguttaceae bacterium]|nr:twin-arginine translocation signal domain-containing protein [Thermoguttaceae bacterium]
MKRRDFMKLSTAMGAAVVLSNARSAFAAPANDPVNLGVNGCGSRSEWVCRDFLVRPQDDVRFTWCCDVDSRRAANRANQVKRDGVDPKLTQDAR